MPEFNKPTFSGGSYILEFVEPVRKIRFEQRRAEDAFGSLINKESSQTNFPDMADPNIPRIVFEAERKKIQISQTRCQFDFNFDDRDMSMDKQLSILERNARDFHTRALTKFAVADYSFNALILAVQFSSKSSRVALGEFIYERFFKSASMLPLASVQFLLGFKVGDFFINLSSEVYESRRALIKTADAASGSLVVRIKDTELVDQGLSFKVDVNNRPRSEIEGYKLGNDPSEIFDVVKNFLSVDFQKLTGLSVI